MRVIQTIAELREQVRLWKSEGRCVGLVPTMGFLHEGHASLIDTAVAQCERTVVSVFVNPTQFGPNEDLEDYPRDFARDCRLLEEHGCDVVFSPAVEEMYPDGFCTYVALDSEMPRQLCGQTRPIHFRGVCTVVCKLFHIVKPDCAYFGEKDAQQLAIIRRMVRDLSLDVDIVGCPIVREADGLAKSSRNTYLSAEERRAARVLSQSVAAGQRYLQAGSRDVAGLLTAMREVLQAEPLARVEYLSAVDAENLQPVTALRGRVLVAMAVHIGRTRLIDNFFYEEETA